MAKRKRAIPQYGTVTLNGIDYYRTRVQNADGKLVALYARTPEELYDKELGALEQIDNDTFCRKSPTVADYCEKWLLMQSEKQIKLQIEQLKKTKDIEEIMHGRWAHMDEFDQDEWLEHLEEHLKEIVNISGKDVHTLAADIEMHRREVHERIAREHPELAERFAQRRHLLDKHLKERRPEVYRIIVQLREDNKHK